jgi:hypothetical protein
VHKRLIPVEDEPALIETIKREHADLLRSDEALEVDRAKKIKLQMVLVNNEWEQRFLEFLVFQRVYGHSLVPKNFMPNKQLGRWCAKVRCWYSKNDSRLTPSRQRRLNAAGFIWKAKKDPQFWKIQNQCEQAMDKWEDFFDRLLVYKAQKGDCLVPKEYPEDMTLARWVAKTRKHYKAKKEGRYHTLDDDKEMRLVEAGFVFNSKTQERLRFTVLKRFEGRWEEYFSKLEKYKERFGHCIVPRRWKEDQSLASWVMRQRCHWKRLQQGLHSYLTEERLAKLEEIGFAFVVARKGMPLHTGPDQEGSEDEDESNENDSDDDTESLRSDEVQPKISRRHRENAGMGLEGETQRSKRSALRESVSCVPAASVSVYVTAEVASGEDLTVSDPHQNKESKPESLDPPFSSHCTASNPTVHYDGEVKSTRSSSQGKNLLSAFRSSLAVKKSEEPPVIKGQWRCESCGKDEFSAFAEFAAHEHSCLALPEFATVP